MMTIDQLNEAGALLSRRRALERIIERRKAVAVGHEPSGSFYSVVIPETWLTVEETVAMAEWLLQRVNKRLMELGVNA